MTCVFLEPALADEDCWNVGSFEKTQIDKKEKFSFSGDIKEVDALFDYDVGSISGSITWNRVPNSSQTTRLIIGFVDNSDDCTTVSEAYKMKGWGKKFGRDREFIPPGYSPDMLGKLSITATTKNSISFLWNKSEIDSDNVIGEHCVRVSTTVPSRYYQNNTTCITTGNVTTCDGPGWYAGLREQDLVIAWALTKFDRIDYMCSGLVNSDE